MQKRRHEASSKIDRTTSLIRCFEDCVNSLASSSSVPLPICYQPSKLYFKLDITNNNQLNNQDHNIYLFDKPCEDISTYYSFLNNFIYLNSDNVISPELIDYLVANSCTRINDIGRWILVTKIKLLDSTLAVTLAKPLWLLKYRYDMDNQAPQLVEINSAEYACKERPRLTKE